MAPIVCPAIQPTPWHLSIGMFIGILGFLGVVVPLIRANIGRREKAAWTAILALLLWLELRSIRLDQTQHDREQEFARCVQLKSFQAIADTLGVSMKASKSQYESTLSHVNGVATTTQTVANLAKESLDSVAGTGSYPCIVPQDHQNFSDEIPLTIYNRGTNILTGVRVLIISHRDLHSWLSNSTIEVGTIPPGFPQPFKVISPVTDDSTNPRSAANYSVMIWAQNGIYIESMEFRRDVSGLWHSLYVLSKQHEINTVVNGVPHLEVHSEGFKDCDNLATAKPYF
jgi:hypothetical protein